MKKILYCLMMLATISFVACGSNDDGSALSSTPAKDVEATYVGKWTQEKYNNNALVETVYSDGKITLSANSDYVVNVEGIANGVFTFDKEGLANIVAVAAGYAFTSATSTDNGFNSDIKGSIENGVITMSYSTTEKVGRATYEFRYYFTGAK